MKAVESTSDLQEVLKELNAIKRLLALALIRDGVSQETVAKAAGVAKQAINRLANGTRAGKKV